jgi:DNA polymerase IV
MRLWAKKKLGLKFDSGGVTNRVTGKAVDLSVRKEAGTEEAERKVFEYLGLEYIDPTLRNTG